MPVIASPRKLHATAALLVLALAGCAAIKPRPPAPAPKPTVVTPAPTTPAPAFAIVDPNNYEQSLDQLKAAQAKTGRDAMPAAEVGYYLDVLLGKLRQVAGRSLVINRQGDHIDIDTSGRWGFEASGSKLLMVDRKALAPLVSVLLEYRMTLVAVHVRGDGAHGRPAHLSEQRALSVAQYLSTAGVSGKRIVVAGDLPNRPPAPKGRYRVEMQLEPIVRPAGSPH